jgi:two-component system, NtrC family, nitrogen regulation sensor histidine kinase NtrY
MDFKVGLLGRIVLLTMTLFILSYTIQEADSVFSISLFVIVSMAQMIMLISYSENSFKKVRQFLSNIKLGNYTTEYPVKFDGSEIDDLHIEFNAILSKLKEDQAEKEGQFQYFRSVFQHLSIGLITYEESGKIQILNTSAKRILNIQQLTEIKEIETVSKELYNAIMGLRTGGSELIKIAHPDGIMQLSVYVIELMMRGQKIKLVSLQNIQSELEEKEMEAWQNLVKVLTHEIMNSIAPITSLANTIKSELESKLEDQSLLSISDMEDISMGVSTIEKRSGGLIHFVSDFRSLAQIPVPKFKAIAISELFDQMELLMKSQLESQTIQVHKQITPDDLILFGDPDLIEQVFINLIQNAIHALEGKENKKIHLKGFIDDSGKIILEVFDNGRGISEDALNKIFVPFFSTKKTGSGIGLSLSKQIMRRHQGNIQVSSTLGEGTVFKLIFNA